MTVGVMRLSFYTFFNREPKGSSIKERMANMLSVTQSQSYQGCPGGKVTTNNSVCHTVASNEEAFKLVMNAVEELNMLHSQIGKEADLRGNCLRLKFVYAHRNGHGKIVKKIEVVKLNPPQKEEVSLI